MGKVGLIRIVYSGIFLAGLVAAIMTEGCGEDPQAQNEKLKKEVANLTAENEKLKTEAVKMRGELSTLHSQVAELNLQVSSLQDQNYTLQKEIDILKDQLKGKRRKLSP